MISAAPPGQLAPAEARPLIWVRKLVVLTSIDPWDEIRKIDFTTGLNIVQSESNENDEDFQSGHGIGKTTVCRLIRFCLGEKTYGQKHVIEEVTHCFPNAYVGAEFELAGSPWSVLLPLGKRTKRFALEGIALGDLMQAEGTKQYDVFTAKLSAVVLANVPVNESLTGGQILLWSHVLAMCSRDQESRYDRHWNWREKRSESGTPVFGKPKVDAGLCLRAILSLLDPTEPKLRTRLDELDAEAKRLHEDIRKERELPATLIMGLRRRLETEFAVQDAMSAPLDTSFFGLAAATNNRQTALRDEIARIEEQLAPLNRRINMTAASLLEPEELAEQIEAASDATSEGTDALLNQLNELQRVRQLLRDVETALCRYGQVLIGECSYVQSRTQQVDEKIRQRQLTVIPTVSEREQAAARLSEQARRQRSLVEQIQQRLDDMGRERDGLIEQRRNLRNQIGRIPAILAEIQDLNEVLEGRKPNTELQRLEQDLSNNVSEVTTSKKRLATLIAAQVDRAKQFAARFDALVKKTLTNDFKGVVDIREDSVDFRIVLGESLSGEAYETLAILLADLALLLESAFDHVHHPGLLIHDSPREADLNLRIYQRLLDVADEEMRTSGQQDIVPYQYIVTTTTVPSKALRKKSITKVELGSGSSSLFGRQLESGKATTVQSTLFGQEGDT